MPDISMCEGLHCPIKNKCYRFTATPNEPYQSYHTWSYRYDNKCRGFESNAKTKTKRDINNKLYYKERD